MTDEATRAESYVASAARSLVCFYNISLNGLLREIDGNRDVILMMILRFAREMRQPHKELLGYAHFDPQGREAAIRHRYKRLIREKVSTLDPNGQVVGIAVVMVAGILRELGAGEEIPPMTLSGAGAVPSYNYPPFSGNRGEHDDPPPHPGTCLGSDGPAAN